MSWLLREANSQSSSQMPLCMFVCLGRPGRAGLSQRPVSSSSGARKGGQGGLSQFEPVHHVPRLRRDVHPHSDAPRVCPERPPTLVIDDDHFLFLFFRLYPPLLTMALPLLRSPEHVRPPLPGVLDADIHPLRRCRTTAVLVVVLVVRACPCRRRREHDSETAAGTIATATVTATATTTRRRILLLPAASVPREADAPRLVEIRALRAVGPVAPGEHHLGDAGAVRRQLERPLGPGPPGAEGPVHVAVEDAGRAGVGVQQDEGVGQWDEPRLDEGL